MRDKIGLGASGRGGHSPSSRPAGIPICAVCYRSMVSQPGRRPGRHRCGPSHESSDRPQYRARRHPCPGRMPLPPTDRPREGRCEQGKETHTEHRPPTSRRIGRTRVGAAAPTLSGRPSRLVISTGNLCRSPPAKQRERCRVDTAGRSEETSAALSACLLRSGAGIRVTRRFRRRRTPHRNLSTPIASRQSTVHQWSEAPFGRGASRATPFTHIP